MLPKWLTRLATVPDVTTTLQAHKGAEGKLKTPTGSRNLAHRNMSNTELHTPAGRAALVIQRGCNLKSVGNQG